MKEGIMGPINYFQGRYRFLSNFWFARIKWKGIVFPTNEHAYQWAKTEDKSWKKKILEAIKPGEAKKLGKWCPMIPDFIEKRVDIMYDINLAKYNQHYELKEKLIETFPRQLIEGNKWHDNFWGQCNCYNCLNAPRPGWNQLGAILMNIRTKFIKELEK